MWEGGGASLDYLLECVLGGRQCAFAFAFALAFIFLADCCVTTRASMCPRSIRARARARA
eukprot:scaffold29394_cov51-Attheya_sp.AAC.2